MYEEAIQVGSEPLEDQEVMRPSVHVGLGTMLAPSNQAGKPHDFWGSGHSIQDYTSVLGNK
jgi:hypothetical protein